ncbi:MAG: DUF1152 domain-containing protein [Myxococcaceae bacterium]
MSETFSMLEPTLFRHLRSCQRVLIAGAGGGFDVYAGLPLALALWNRGQEVHLANLSFSYLESTDADQPSRGLFRVEPGTRMGAARGARDYFPERSLAQFLEQEKRPSTVWAFTKAGVDQLRASYQWLVDHLKLDAIVLVDGGTDILMFGDEISLGTPTEDMSSLAAVGQLKLAHRHVACLGFGVDAYHGVSHGLVLENIAALERDGAYHGAFSVSQFSSEGSTYLRAVEHTQRAHAHHPSIVNGSIAAALKGEFGDVQFTARTNDSELFINPLMGLCARNTYVCELVNAPSPMHVSLLIEAAREGKKLREAKPIPH